MIRVAVVARSPALQAGLGAMLVDQLEMQWVDDDARTLNAIALSVAGVSVTDVLVFASAEDFTRNQGMITPSHGLVVLADDERTAAQVRATATDGWALLTPDASADALRMAVMVVAQGLTLLPAALARQLLPSASADSLAEAAEIALTPREQEVLDCLGRGLPNKLIAQALGITEATAKFHVSAVYAKLNVVSRAEAISKAARLGMITL